MANLSNINNILRVSSSGVGLNKNNTGPSELDIESSGADMIDMTRTGQKTYRFAISGTSAFSLFDVAANADRLIIDSSGNVGIGGSPNAKFSVLESTANTEYASMGSGSTVARHLKFSGFIANGTNNVGHRLSALNAIALNVAGDDALYIDNSGNVGIGETSLNSRLIIKNTSANDGIRIHTSDTSEGYLIFRDDSAASPGAIVYDHSVDMLSFKVNGVSDRVNINSSGNVGINDDIGRGKLAIKTSGSFTTDSNDNDFSGVNIVMKTGNTATNAVGSGMVWLKGGNDSRKVAAITNYIYGDTDQSGLNFYVQQTTSGSSAALTEAMRINSSGNVGIGTGSPNNLLNLSRNVANGDVATYIQNFNADVGSTNETASVKFAHGNDGVVGYVGGKLVCGKEGDFETSIANIKGNLQFYTASGTSLDSDVNNIERMRINSSGNVGIGVTPNASYSKLQVKAPASSYGFDLIGRDAGVNGESQITFWNSNQTTQLAAIFNIADNLGFTTGTTERMRITSDGKIGLNTSSFAPTISNQLKLGDMGSGVVGEVLDASVVNGAARMIICSGGATGQVPILSLRHYSAAYGIDIWMYWASPWNTYIDNRHPSSGFIFRNNCNASGGENALMEISGTGRILMHGLDGKTQVHPDVSYRTSDGELFYQTSSIRYKKDIVNLENSLNKIDSLRPVRFTDINTNEPSFGLIAEETNEIIPDVVFTKDEQIEGISYSNLTPFLIKAIQELKADNDSLKARIETLENN
eukprot:SAG31_NODE_660_length_13050_cov_28.393638_6_plen_754_part_00